MPSLAILPHIWNHSKWTKIESGNDFTRDIGNHQTKRQNDDIETGKKRGNIENIKKQIIIFRMNRH